MPGGQAMEILEMMEHTLKILVEIAILIFEYIGVGIIIYSGLRGFYLCLKKSPETKLALAKGLAMGLEFKMGSEVLRTVVVRDWEELGILGAVILLRGLLTILIHWEIKNEEKNIHN